MLFILNEEIYLICKQFETFLHHVKIQLLNFQTFILSEQRRCRNGKRKREANRSPVVKQLLRQFLDFRTFQDFHHLYSGRPLNPHAIPLKKSSSCDFL